MNKLTVSTTPISGQKAGTSGLRQKTKVFMQPNFLENYVQSILNAQGGIEGKTFIVGGDGRFFNDQAIQTILRMLSAHGAARAIVGQGGILSTPAASHLIRLKEADGGFILSASHNPGGIDEDFGLKFNMANGGPATEALTEAIFQQTQALTEYKTLESPDLHLGEVAELSLAGMTVSIIDPVADYAKLMSELFDFPAIKQMFESGFTMAFDAMHAVTGPYAREILERQLGAAQGTVLNGTPLPDFGGGHPDPNPIWAHELMRIMTSPDAPDFGAASDGDGDRNMIVGRGAYVTPSDSLALIAAQASCAPAYNGGLKGIARSMPTSGAVDRVAKAKGLACYETPTGWKFFGGLMDDGRVSLCGEESAGTGSDHVREKDGLWAVLMWLNIIANRGISVAQLMAEHWQSFGRNYYSRHDYEAVETAAANDLMDNLRSKLAELPGTCVGTLTVCDADEFAYQDPVDGSLSTGQGIRIMFEGGGRVVFRLSGTGTEGATLRVYLEQLQTDPDLLHSEAADALTEVASAAQALAEITARTGRTKPDVIT